jgi:hypothetical protein
MKKTHSAFLRTLPSGVAATVLSALPVQGALLVYEGFTGYSGSTLAGKMPNANTVGLDTAVAYAGSAGDGPGNFSLVTGLTFSNLVTSGQAVSFNDTPANSVASARLALQSNYNGPLYSSYLVNLSGKGTGSNNGFEIRIANDDASGGARFRTFADTRTGTSNVPGVDYQGPNTDGIADSTGPVLTNGTTYLIVGSFTRAGQGLTSGSPGVGTMYAFTTSQFDYMMGQSDPTAYLESLTAENIGTGANQISAFARETVTSNTHSFSNGNRLQWVNVKDNGTVDEIRFGSDFLSVVPIPEPASAAFASFAVAALSFRRKR